MPVGHWPPARDPQALSSAPFFFASSLFIAVLGEIGAQIDELQIVQPRVPAPLPCHPGLLQTVLALKVDEVECQRWGWGTVGIEGRSVLLGPFACAGKSPRCNHRALRGEIPL